VGLEGVNIKCQGVELLVTVAVRSGQHLEIGSDRNESVVASEIVRHLRRIKRAGPVPGQNPRGNRLFDPDGVKSDCRGATLWFLDIA
jgi:hypothetical protein